MMFLRPWFLLLLLIPVFFRIRDRLRPGSSPWRTHIDPKLLPYLLTGSANKSTRIFNYLRLMLWSLLCVALAGPAWYDISVPTRAAYPATVVVADLGPGMSDSDIRQVRQKVYDLLTLLPDDQVGIVIYDKYGYTVSPLTYDKNLLRQMLPSLRHNLLPEPSESDVLAGFQQARKLFQQAHLRRGRILFLTGGTFVSEQDITTIQKYPYKVGVLGIGSPELHPVSLPDGGFAKTPTGQVLMTRLDSDRLSRLGTYRAATPDPGDLQDLLSRTDPTAETDTTASAGQLTYPQDMGVFLVLLSLPLMLYLFRKNVLFALLLCLSFQAHADLWHRPDQESYARQLRGVQAYRAGHYKAAADLFQTGFNPDDLYNLGNALAHQNRFQEAIDTYARVLQVVPDHADALYNKEYLERQLQPPPPEPEKSDTDQTDPDDSPEPSPPASANNAPDSASDSSSPQSQGDRQSEPPPPPSNQPDSAPESGDTPQPMGQTEPQSSDPVSARLFNQIQTDTDGLLRYRIRRQYIRHTEGK